MSPETDDPQNKVAIKVKRKGPAPLISSTSTPAVQVQGDVVHQDADVGEATLTIAGPAGELVEEGKTYQLVAVGQ